MFDWPTATTINRAPHLERCQPCLPPVTSCAVTAPEIAHYAYRPELGSLTSARTAFFPLYPLGLRTISWFGLPPVLAGVLLSLLALMFALYGIHRLTTLELARAGRLVMRRAGSGDVARLAVMITAFA